MNMADFGLMIRAQQVLQMTRAQFADLTGTSLRTVQRWVVRQSPIYPEHFQAAARAVYRVDPILAARLAEAGGTTLAAMGVEQRAPVAELSIPPAEPAVEFAEAPFVEVPVEAPPPFVPDTRYVVDSVVAVVADALDLPPKQVRPALRAAFVRAKAVGLSVDAVAAALAPEPASGDASIAVQPAGASRA